MIGSLPLRVGLFTHSTNPRGGVVHVLELAAALGAMGHDVVVHAPDPSRRGFFRPPAPGVRHALIPALPAPEGLPSLVRQRIEEYVDYLLPRGTEFDVYHAHDGISGGALANVAAEGIIPGFVRTVHHLDEFSDPYLRETQDRSVTAAALHLCVSRLWQDALLNRYGIAAAVVANGVDMSRFSPNRQPDDERFLPPIAANELRPLFLGVGGVERRKNTLNILRAFLIVRRRMPSARLLIVGSSRMQALMLPRPSSLPGRCLSKPSLRFIERATCWCFLPSSRDSGLPSSRRWRAAHL